MERSAVAGATFNRLAGSWGQADRLTVETPLRLQGNGLSLKTKKAWQSRVDQGRIIATTLTTNKKTRSDDILFLRKITPTIDVYLQQLSRKCYPHKR